MRHFQVVAELDQALAVENELCRMEADDGITRGVEHVLAAKEFVTHVPAGIDRSRVDDEIDAARVLFRVEDDGAIRPPEVPALPAFDAQASLLARLFPGVPESEAVVRLIREHPIFLVAISNGSVFMGANTYIGNGPNFMVKAIAEENKITVQGVIIIVSSVSGRSGSLVTSDQLSGTAGTSSPRSARRSRQPTRPACWCWSSWR